MPRHIRPPYLAALQNTLADNARLLMDRKFAGFSSKDDRITELAKEAGIGRNTVYRIVDPDGAVKDGAYRYPRLDSIAALARALGHSTVEMLTSDFAMRAQANEPRKRKPAA